MRMNDPNSLGAESLTTPHGNPENQPRPAQSVPGQAPGFRPGASYQPRPIKPRKVRGGIKLMHADPAFAESWPAQRWMSLVRSHAREEAMVAGLDYARQ